MNVSIIGTGYVGLVTGACLAEKGHRVVCVDVDEEKVGMINQGIPPFFEMGLEDLLKRQLGVGFRATTDVHQSVIDADISLIAVGTPFDGREIDLSYVKEAARQIGKALRDKTRYSAAVVKSTVVPGTTDDVVGPILESTSGKMVGRDFGLGMNPEFLTEGQAIEDFMRPDRIVLGANDEKSMKLMEQLYDKFKSTPILRTNNKTAEMIKYAANATLATQISFANEIANMCSALGGVDVVDVMRGVHLSYYLRPLTKQGERVQAPISSFLEAGCGFGGSCLPKDVKALIAHGEKLGSPMRLLNAVISINEIQPKHFLTLLRKHFPVLQGLRVSVLGLAFKPDTSDIRESPAIPTIQSLLREGALIKAYDPAAIPEAKKVLGDDQVTFCTGLENCIQGSDAIVLVTRWSEFKRVPEILAVMEPQPLVVDGRRMLDKDSVKRYEGIGL